MLPTGYMYGLDLFSDPASPYSVTVTAGKARSLADDDDLHAPSAFSVAIEGWNELSGGGLDVGPTPITAYLWAWLVSAGSFAPLSKVLFSASATNPVLPAGYVSARRIGSLILKTDGTIRPFRQINGRLDLLEQHNMQWGNIAGGPVLRATGVPLGGKLWARMGVATVSSTPGYVAVTDPSLGVPLLNQSQIYYQPANQIMGREVTALTDTLGRVYVGHSGAGATTSQTILNGWDDDRDIGG